MTDVHLQIDNQLGKSGRVDLPGLGSIYLEKYNAIVDIVTSTISPPGKCIKYDASGTLKAGHYLSDSLISGERVQIFVDDLQQTIHSGNVYHIHNIGAFSIDREEICFEADPQSSHTMMGRELKTITFTPLKKSYKRQEISSEKLIVARSHRSRYRRWVVPAVFTLLALNLFLIGFAFYKQYQTDIFHSLKINLPEGRLNVKPADDQSLPDAPVLYNDEEESVVPEDSLKLIFPDEDSSARLQSLEAEIDLPVKEEKSAIEDVTGLREKGNDSPPALNRGELQPNGRNAVLLDFTRSDGDCAVVMGAFAKEENVIRMKETLEKEGYFVFVEKGARLTRVGVLIPCLSAAQALVHARSGYNKEAWIHSIKE